MTTAIARPDTPPAPTTIPPCPAWCRLSEGHGWDSWRADDLWSRGHQGPRFGDYVSVCSTEFSDVHGTHSMEIVIDPNVEGNVDLPEYAREFAGFVLAAAAWVEAQA